MALDFFAGCLGGCAGVIVGHPFDTIKVILQTERLGTKKSTSFDCLKSLVAKEGPRGLYKGMSSPLAGVAGLNAIVFGIYGNVQRKISDSNSIASHFWAGCIAGFVQSYICSPMELVKSRLQVSSTHMGPIQCLKHIRKVEGYKGLKRGLVSTMVRDVPAFGIYFASYEAMTRTKDGSPVSVMNLLVAGGLAGTISWIIYPVDVIKSRMQVDGLNGSYKYKNEWDCFRKSVTSEGYRWMVKGFPLVLLRAFPVNAVCFTTVSLTMRFFEENKSTSKKDTPVYDYCPDKTVFINGNEFYLNYATL